MPRLYPDLRKRMHAMHIDREYLASKIGISPNSVSRRMCGLYPWTLDEAYKVLDVLRLDESELGNYFTRGGYKKWQDS